MQPSSRLDRLAPYLFAELERKIREKRAAGVDVISLGIGDPDTPTPRPVIDALAQAAADPGTHQYPSNRGRPELRGPMRASTDSASASRSTRRRRSSPRSARRSACST
jgi:LL-diaminopimelate aminotransferase